MLENDTFVMFTSERFGDRTVTIERQERHLEELVLPAYFPVCRRVNVEPAERDLVPQFHWYTLFEELLQFQVIQIPCRPKVDDCVAIRRKKGEERFRCEVGHCHNNRREGRRCQSLAWGSGVERRCRKLDRAKPGSVNGR